MSKQNAPTNATDTQGKKHMNFSTNGFEVSFNIDVEVFAASIAEAVACKVYDDVKATVAAPLNAGRKAREVFNAWVDRGSEVAAEAIDEAKDVAADARIQATATVQAVATATAIRVHNRAVRAVSPVVRAGRIARARVNAVRAAYRAAIADYCDISEVGIIAKEVPTIVDGSIVSSAGYTSLR